MQRSEVRFAAVRDDYSLIVITLTPPVVESVIELFAIPLIPRDGGFLIAVPRGALDESLISESESPDMTPSWLGIGTILNVPMVEEDETGAPVSLGISGPVMAIDVTDEILFYSRAYDPVTDSDHDICPFHSEHSACIPDLEALLGKVRQWLHERTDGTSGFYSAQEDPGVAAKKSGAPPKKATAAKRVSNAALLDQMNMIMAQLQSLSVRQDVLEKKAEVAPASVGAAVAPPGGNVNKLPDLSEGLASVGGPPLDVPKALQLIGPPPRTQLGKVQTKQVLAPQAPEDPNAVLLGLDAGEGNHGAIVNALSQQSNALTALVAHFANQSSDCLTDLQSGFSTSSSMKGVQRREKLQSELASRTGNFFLLLMQQIHKKLTPGRTLPRSVEEVGSISMLEYLSKSGGYRNQKTLGLIQWILGHAVDAAAQDDFAGVKEIIALLAMAIEQANYDNGEWSVAYLISLHEEPPIQLFQERAAAIMATGRPFSPLIPPVWSAATLSYIRDMEVLANKKPEAKKGPVPKEGASSESVNLDSPRRKPRFPKRPKQAQEGEK